MYLFPPPFFWDRVSLCIPGLSKTHYIAEASLKEIPLPQPPEHWDWRCVHSHLDKISFVAENEARGCFTVCLDLGWFLACNLQILLEQLLLHIILSCEDTYRGASILWMNKAYISGHLFWLVLVSSPSWNKTIPLISWNKTMTYVQ